MCGIIAYQGRRDARKVIWQGLCQLEYRGYDSWGIGLFQEQGVKVVKKVGKISETKFSAFASLNKAQGGIGHTRWATHGKVSCQNAHPQVSASKRIYLVHNGILENFEPLKKELKIRGCRFRSDTDTEVIANLLDFYLQKAPLAQAVFRAFRRMEGRNAFVAYDANAKKMVGIKTGSPLIFGSVADKDFFLASDLAAFGEFRPQVRYLEDGELIEIGQGKVIFYRKGRPLKVRPKLHLIDQAPLELGRGHYPHYMIKEIKEQRDVIVKVLKQQEAAMEKAIALLQKARNVFLVGAGTAGRVCHFGEYLFSMIVQRNARFFPASESKWFGQLLSNNDVMIVVSQSGETADTLEAIQIGRRRGATIVAIVNVAHSTIARIADLTLLTHVGAERAVASTKATTAQLALLTMLVFGAWGQLKEGERLVENLGQCAAMLFKSSAFENRLKRLAKMLCVHPDVYIIGRGANYPLALEAAIKLQEVGYIHAQGFAGGELKHGPLALITQGTPVIVLVDPENPAEILSNAQEIKSRGGFIIGIAERREQVFDCWLPIPPSGFLQPILSLLPIQLLAYYLAVAKGINPDLPRNLAKSVTVK